MLFVSLSAFIENQADYARSVIVDLLSDVGPTPTRSTKRKIARRPTPRTDAPEPQGRTEPSRESQAGCGLGPSNPMGIATQLNISDRQLCGSSRQISEKYTFRCTFLFPQELRLGWPTKSMLAWVRANDHLCAKERSISLRDRLDHSSNHSFSVDTQITPKHRPSEHPRADRVSV